MDKFVEGIGERYHERKAHTIPHHLENHAKKHIRDTATGQNPTTPSKSPGRPSHEQDHEIERLRRELASAKTHRGTSRGDTIHSYHEAPRPSHGPYVSTRSIASSEGSSRHSAREEHRHQRHHEASPPSLSQSTLNRLALQHADTGPLPLKAKNLELLASQQDCIDRTCKHGGSAALLHAAHSQSGRREPRVRESLDEKGHLCTEAFRPRRVDEQDLYLVQVEEEEDERDRERKREAREARRVEEERIRKKKDGVTRERGAVEVGRSERRTVYKIR